MTEHLTLNTVVHAAFRRTLARFDSALEAFPDGSGQRAGELKCAWDFFEHEIHFHHDAEEQFFWPALQQTDADLHALVDLDREHNAMRVALEAASQSVATLQTTPTSVSAGTARTAVAHLKTVLLDHLAHEERDLEPISAAYQGSAPMKAALNQVKKANLKNMGNFVEWIQDGADASDLVALRRELPAPVIFLFGTFAGRRYRREIARTWSAK